MLKPISATGLSAWASYLVNGDAGELEPEELAVARQFALVELGAMPVDCEDAGFIWKPDSWRYWPQGGDCQVYTALVESGA